MSSENYLYIVVGTGAVWGYVDSSAYDIDDWNTNYVEYVSSLFNLIASYDYTQTPASSSSFGSGYLNESQTIDFSDFYSVESVVEV